VQVDSTDTAKGVPMETDSPLITATTRQSTIGSNADLATLELAAAQDGHIDLKDGGLLLVQSVIYSAVHHRDA